MTARTHTLAAILAGTLLSGCMTMGGTVKGDFACRAPDGICAPSSVIDDRALAMILGGAPEAQTTPAGPYTPAPDVRRGQQVADANPARSREKVLRIVFPSHIDASGRLYEQTAVHAVVENSDWQSASVGAPVASSPAQVASSAAGGPLFSAVDRVSIALTDTGDGDAGADPDAPSAAAVAAARARASDPIGDIKAQVASKLAVSQTRTAATHPGAPRSTPPRIEVGKTALPVDASVSAPARQAVAVKVPVAPAGTRTAPVNRTVTAAKAPAPSPAPVATGAVTPPAPPVAAGIATPAHATPEGKAAVARLQANPALAAGVGGMSAAAMAARPPVALPVLRAPSFPGAPQ